MSDETIHNTDELPVLIVKTIHLALQRMEMYGAEHKVSLQAIKKAYKLIRELFGYTHSFTLSLSGEEILFDKNPLEATYFTQRFVDDFNNYNIHSITFHERITENEFLSFLEFLVRSPGRNLEKRDLEEYLSNLGIESIAVDKIKYIAVTGDVDEQAEAQKVLTDILSRHSGVLEKLLGEKTQEILETDGGAILPELLPSKANEYDVVDILTKLIEDKGLLDKNDEEISETDKQLMKIIDTVRENLSDEAKKIFLDKVNEITDKIVVEKDKSEQLLEKEFTLSEVSTLDSISDIFQESLQNGWDENAKYHFHNLVERLFDSNDPSAIDALLDNMLEFFEKTKALWTNEAFKVIIESAFAGTDDVTTGFLLGELLHRKEMVDVNAASSSLLTASLVYFSSLLFMSNKFTTIIRILQEYEKRIKETMSFEALDDFQAFIDGLSSQENLHKMLAITGENNLTFDLELKVIIGRMDGRQVCDVIIDELGQRKSGYTNIAVQLLEPHIDVAREKIEDYIHSMARLNRSDKGFIIDTEQLRRTFNIFTLAVKLDKEWALSLLLLATVDRDTRIRKHIFFLLMIYPPEQVENAIEAMFIEGNKEFRDDIIRSICERPNSLKDYYMRQIILFFPDLRNFILQALSENNTEYSKNLLIEIMNNWIIYIDQISQNRIKPFLIKLINALGRFADDPRVKKSLKQFRSEWRGEGILKTSYSLFSFKKDDIMKAVDEVFEK
ncbi:hypothetical protein J7L68_03215 [bacterium]|nr:hypothetical protein [bacterium]